MPRGKNYVNNNKGVTLQATAKSKSAMKLCEYGSGCNRPDCIYRHDGTAGAKMDEVCLPFLADKCSFTTGGGCRKRHPKKEERARLLAKYKRTRCRFGDECYTESCLYIHPREMEPTEPYYVEPHDVAFPPLSGAAPAPPAVKQPPADSPWNNVVAPEMPTPGFVPQLPPPPHHGVVPGWFSHQAPMVVPYYPGGMAYYNEPGMYMQTPPPQDTAAYFNANAKEFVPNSTMG